MKPRLFHSLVSAAMFAGIACSVSSVVAQDSVKGLVPSGNITFSFWGIASQPWQVMIDADGKVAFYHPGEDMAELRTAIAKLAPQYGSLAPKAEPKKDE